MARFSINAFCQNERLLLDERWYRDMNQTDQIPNFVEYVNNHLDDVTEASYDYIPEPENIEDSNMSVQDDSMEQIDVIEEEIDSDVICEQKIESFKSLINNELCNFVVANWEDKSVQKCFDALAGKVASSVKGGVEKFKWYCYGFWHELSAKQKSGKKKKNGK